MSATESGVRIARAERMRAWLALLMAGIVLFASGSAMAFTEEYFSEAVSRIRSYTGGKLLYDAAYLEPRCGPGTAYAPDYRFDLKEGSEIRVLTLAYDKAGNQWAMVEGETSGGLMRVYLLYYDSKNAEYTITVENARKLILEAEPDMNMDGCMLDETPLRTGPGEEYALLNIRFNYGSDPAIVAANKGWVMVEYLEDEEITETPLRFRGWVPYSAVLAY